MMDSAALASRTQSQASVHSIASKPGHRPLDLFVGAVSTTRAGEVKRIVMGNDLIAEASILDDGELLVLGKSPGITELQVLTEASGTHEYLVRVYPAPPADALDLLRIALLPFPDLAIESKLGRLIVTGTVDAADFERYTSVVRGFPTVLSTVTPQLNVLIEPSVVLDVAVLEVNRSYQKTVGVRWQDTASGPATGIVGTSLAWCPTWALSPTTCKTCWARWVPALSGSVDISASPLFLVRKFSSCKKKVWLAYSQRQACLQ